MLKILFLLSLLIPSALSKCGREQTAINEGTILCCYYDTVNIPTIGIGFNLQRSDAAGILENYNIEVSDVIKDCEDGTKLHCLTRQQANEMYVDVLYPKAVAIADRFISGLPEQKYYAIVDMAYNLGATRLNKFVKMKAALVEGNWELAAAEARNSKWCGQVGRRCDSDYECILNGE